MVVKTCPMTEPRVLEYLKEHLPGLETLGVRNFRQLERLIEAKEELDFQVPIVDPVPPPERPVRVIHAGHTVKVPKPVVVVDTREQAGFAYSLAQAKSPYPESQAHPNAVVGTLLALQERWGIQVIWCDNAELAEETVAHILSKHYTLQWLKDNRLPRHFVDGDV